MAKYSLEPQPINDDNWYYENKKGIEVIHRAYGPDGKLVSTNTIVIPWRMIAVSLARHRRRT